MRDAQARAWRRRQAAPVDAGTVLELLCAGGYAEVGGGATYVVDVALECGVFGHELGLGEQRLVATRLDDAALVEVERAKRAIAHATAIAREREPHLGKRGHATGLRVRGMRVTCEGQRVDGIHLGHRKWLGRWVLHDEDIVRILLDEDVRGKRVEVFMLNRKTGCVFPGIRLHGLEARQNDRVIG